MGTEYLAFVDFVGKTLGGEYTYRFEFTLDKDVAWGDFFNIAPSLIVPDLKPDQKCLSSYIKAVFPREMLLAKKNSCFSMQDCIDSILPLCFSEIDENTLRLNGKPVKFMFGEEKEEIVGRLCEIKVPIIERENIETDSTAVDELINQLDSNDDNDDEW